MNEQYPHDVDAERSLLGACLISVTAVEDTIGMITADDFHVPAHQHIWQAIIAAHTHGRADNVTVADALRLAGLLDTIGGTAALLDLTHTTPAVSNAARYASIVVAHKVSSRLISVAADIAALGWRAVPSDDPADAIDRARDLLNDIEVPMVDAGPDADLRQFISDTPTEYNWLIPGFLERQDRMLVTSGEGLGKSTLLAQIAVMGACGIHPWTYRPFDPVNALIVDCENARRLIARRLEGLRAVAGDRLDPSRLRVISLPAGLDLTSRTDRHWLIGRCQVNMTDLLVIGPLYRLFNAEPARGDSGGELLSSKVTRALDEVRAKCDVTLIVETHAGHPSGGHIRELRPIGSSVWLRWPEFGVGLREDKDKPHVYNLSHWRGPRDRRVWPKALSQGGKWPWTPEGMPTGTFAANPNQQSF